MLILFAFFSSLMPDHAVAKTLEERVAALESKTAKIVCSALCHVRTDVSRADEYNSEKFTTRTLTDFISTGIGAGANQAEAEKALIENCQQRNGSKPVFAFYVEEFDGNTFYEDSLTFRGMPLEKNSISCVNL